MLNFKILNSFFIKLRPYLFISLTGIIAFFPVSFMLFSLKNDILTIDYPIKFFLSQCIQNNVQPFWFNTWALGFPLESILTWSIFSPVGFLWALIFNYNLYTLHFEFICYIVLSGTGMYYLLEKHISQNSRLNIILSCSYMLSGFVIGSSQWLTYITSNCFFPFTICFFLTLLKRPSVKSLLLFCAFYYIQLTTVYPAFNIINFYIFIALVVCYFFCPKIWAPTLFAAKKKTFFFLGYALVIISIISFVPIFSSVEVLSSISRGQTLNPQTSFYDSNYFHTKGLISLLLPLSSTKIQIYNSEGSMNHCFWGITPILLFPLSVAKNIKERNLKSFVLLSLIVLFFLFSFGNLTQFRNYLNVFPGFSYFRNPALFRFYATFIFVIYLSESFKGSFRESLNNYKSLIYSTIIVLAIFYLMILLATYSTIDFTNFHFSNFPKAIKAATWENVLFISASFQLFLILLFYIYFKAKRIKQIKYISTVDLVFNSLLCLPFFTISSFSVKETNNILKITDGFPIQTQSLLSTNTFIKKGNAIWYNTNVFSKQVSIQPSNFGPLILKNFTPTDSLEAGPNEKDYNNLIYVHNLNSAEVEILVQNPELIKAKVFTKSPAVITFRQNYYPGWHAFLNGKEIKIYNTANGMDLKLSKSGMLEIKYNKPFYYLVAILTNITILSIMIFFLTRKIMTTFNNIKIETNSL